MSRLLVLLLCLLLALAEAGSAQATPAEAAPIATEEATVQGKIPRPRYKRYRGNSRRRRGPVAYLKRAAARRKARREQQGKARRRGVITVDQPVRTSNK